jgi:hypothetical protein
MYHMYSKSLWSRAVVKDTRFENLRVNFGSYNMYCPENGSYMNESPLQTVDRAAVLRRYGQVGNLRIQS